MLRISWGVFLGPKHPSSRRLKNIAYSLGLDHLFTPLLPSSITVPGTMQEGYYVEYFMQEPDSIRSRKLLATTTTTQAQVYFAGNLPDGVTEGYWVRVSTIYTAEPTCRVQLSLCVIGKGRLYVDGVEKIDLFTKPAGKVSSNPYVRPGQYGSYHPDRCKEGTTVRD